MSTNAFRPSLSSAHQVPTMPQPFCQRQPSTASEQQFVRLVNQRQHDALDRLLTTEAALRERIDECWFSFDAPAIVAAKHDPQIVRVLLKHGADINARSNWWAGSFGVLEGVSPEEAAYLVKRGARFDIHTAAEQGELELVKEFLDRDPTLVNARGGDGQTPLHFASTTDVVELLINSGADLEVRCLDHSATALQYAVEDEEKCRKLLLSGATPDIFLACALGDRELMEIVLAQEPHCLETRVGECPHTQPIDPRSHHHIYFWKLLGAQTALEVCQAFNHAGLYRELFDRASTKQKFLNACWEAESEQARQLLDQHPMLLSQLDDREAALMARAAWDGRLESVHLMLDVGFDPHLVGDEHSTPLDRAAFHGDVEIVKLLLEKDPHPPLNIKNIYGGVPLSGCVYGATHSWKKKINDHLATAKALVAAGAEVDPNWLPVEDPIMDQFLRDCLARNGE